jgi:hypothetical protein
LFTVATKVTKEPSEIGPSDVMSNLVVVGVAAARICPEHAKTNINSLE